MKLILKCEKPAPKEFCDLRLAAGLSARSLQGAKTGLNNTPFMVTIRTSENELIGMGRVIGDGGLAFQVSDIAVHPNFQGKGLGKKIMEKIFLYLQTLDNKAFISLIADGKAKELYRQFGFRETAPYSAGMYFVREKLCSPK